MDAKGYKAMVEEIIRQQWFNEPPSQQKALQELQWELFKHWAVEENKEKAISFLLPRCNEERGKLVTSAIDPCTWYNPWFCVYHRYLDSDSTPHKCTIKLKDEE